MFNMGTLLLVLLSLLTVIHCQVPTQSQLTCIGGGLRVRADEVRAACGTITTSNVPLTVSWKVISASACENSNLFVVQCYS